MVGLGRKWKGVEYVEYDHMLYEILKELLKILF